MKRTVKPEKTVPKVPPQEKPRILGLTGGIACGKSTASAWLEKKGIPVVDADSISHALGGPNTEMSRRVRRAFGDRALAADGSLNRPWLNQQIFHSAQARHQLEKIAHPLIRSEMDRQIKSLSKLGHPVILLSAPLLFEAGLERRCDATLVISCKLQTQIERLRCRNQYPRPEALRRIHAQMPLAEKKRHATWVVENNGTLAQFEKDLETFWRGYTLANPTNQVPAKSRRTRRSEVKTRSRR